MNGSETLTAFLKAGAVRTDGHFRYTTGRHGKTYLNKDAVFADPALASRFGKAIAERFEDDDIDVVAGPAIGGAILAQWVAHHLSHLMGRSVAAAYAEKTPGGFILRRGYADTVANRRVLAVEDIVTTGSSARALLTCLRAADGRVAGLAALCDRGNTSWHDVGKPVRYTVLSHYPMETWEASECPLCRKNVPLTRDFGHG